MKDREIHSEVEKLGKFIQRQVNLNKYAVFLLIEEFGKPVAGASYMTNIEKQELVRGLRLVADNIEAPLLENNPEEALN